MSRMRLMQGEEAAANALVCLYCGAEAESEPPYLVMYCYCRSMTRDDAGRAGGANRPSPAVQEAA